MKLRAGLSGWFSVMGRAAVLRRLTLAAFLPVVSVWLAACDPALEQKYYKEGIGTEIARPDIATVTALQDLYLSELCRQTGMVPMVDGVCSPVGLTPNWGVIVEAGMNDIDARCDAYLAWLDDKRRSQEPILSEINAVQTTSQALMRVAGVGADPITMVGLAFGLASNTFTNIRSRLLLEANHSTVQSIVLSRQKEYRDGLMKQRIVTRAEAVYAMRSYLRICMPMTIEMQINTTITIYEQAGVPGIAMKRDNPLIDPRTVTRTAPVVAPLTAGQQITKRTHVPPPSDVLDLSAIATAGNKLLTTRTDLQTIQDHMCGIPATERGTVGKATLFNVLLFEALAYPNQKKVNARRDKLLDPDETTTINGSGACPKGAKNYFEKIIFPEGENGKATAQDFAEYLNKAQPERSVDPKSVTSLEDLRLKIAAVRASPPANVVFTKYAIDVSTQVTPDFWEALRK